MKKISTVICSFLLVGFLSVVPLFAIAQTPGGGGSTSGTPGGGGSTSGTPGGGGSSQSVAINFQNPLSIGETTISGFIRAVLENIVIPIGAVASVFFIIYAGFMFVTARGSEDKLKSAKTAILNAVIGSLIILGSWAIAQVISGTVAQLGGPSL